jgi:hypothetical protein
MTELVLYKEIVGLLGATGDAIIKITDGIKHLIVTGVSGYNHIAADRERKRLIRMSAVATDLASTHQAIVVRSIDEYLDSSEPTIFDWIAVKEGVSGVLEEIRDLLDDVREERSEFVLESAYERLLRSLGIRSSFLEGLSRVPPPTTEEERDALREINNEYKRLLKAFSEAIEQLNLYLKSKKNA